MITLNYPANISILLHIYAKAEPLPYPESITTANCIEMLLAENIIENEVTWTSGYKVTPKGAAWISLLCNTPSPQTAFVDSNGKLIP